MNININELKDWKDSTRRELDHEDERLRERHEQIGYYMHVLEATDELISEIDNLNEKLGDMQAEIDSLNEQLREEKDKNQTLEMRLSELTKLSAGMARKSSQEEVLKALRIFINKSKQKRIEKRMAVKELVLELANANGIVFPEDLAVTLDSLDDEQPVPKEVHVAGNYNDIHDNDNVDLNSKQNSEDGRK